MKVLTIIWKQGRLSALGSIIGLQQTSRCYDGYVIMLFIFDGFLSVGKKTSPCSKGERVMHWCESVLLIIYKHPMSHMIAHSPLWFNLSFSKLPFVSDSIV